jgi:hypothetical protein
MIENCQHCGGTHYGSNKCPFLPDEMEANKRAADEGFWRKRRESEKRNVPSAGENS